MSGIYIDPTGQPTYGIALCARCSRKFPLARLSPDPNSPGLMVCDEGCRDEYDPYRLPARQSENITLPFSRPDVPLTDFETTSYFALATETNTNILILTENNHPIEIEFATDEDFLMLTDGGDSMVTDDEDDMIVEEAA